MQSGPPTLSKTKLARTLTQAIFAAIINAAGVGALVCSFCYIGFSLKTSIFGKLFMPMLYDVGIGYTKFFLPLQYAHLAPWALFGVPLAIFGYQILSAYLDGTLGISEAKNEIQSPTKSIILGGLSMIFPLATFSLSMLNGMALASAMWLTFGVTGAAAFYWTIKEYIGNAFMEATVPPAPPSPPSSSTLPPDTPERSELQNRLGELLSQHERLAQHSTARPGRRRSSAVPPQPAATPANEDVQMQREIAALLSDEQNPPSQARPRNRRR